MKIIELIEKHFPNEEGFTPNDFDIKTGIDIKVAAMNLKKLANSHRIGYLPKINIYWNWGIEECNKRRVEANEIIDKYKLKNKKFKILCSGS